MNTKKIAEKIRKDYEKIKSLRVNYKDEQDFIELLGMKYIGKEENFSTENQIDFIYSFDNVSCYKTNLKNANKWFMSACIEIAKKYPEQKFEIIV